MKDKRKSSAMKLFDQAVQRRLPQFLRDRSQEARLPSGTLVYRRASSPERTIFFSMQLSPKRSGFTLEGAWTDDGVYPSYTAPLPPELNSGDLKGRLRIGSLLDSSSPDHWWWLRSQASVPSVVNEAVSDLEEYLIPFLLTTE